MTSPYSFGLTSLPSRFENSFPPANADTVPGIGQLFPFVEAFNNEWDRWAHFTGYQIIDTPIGAPVYRLNKTAESLPELQGRIALTTVCLDFDITDEQGEKIGWKGIPDPAAPDRWLQYIQGLTGPLGQWAHWCTSASGWHLTYVLSSHLTPSIFENVARGIRREFHSLGIQVDEQCSDWTRLYAFPKVVKPDGTATWKQSWYREAWANPARTLNPDDIRPEAAAKGLMSYRAAEAARPKDMPDPDTALALIYKLGDRWSLTPLGARLRKKLEECLPYANEHANAVRELISSTGSFPLGMRDHAVSQTTGWVVSKCITLEEASAEAIFGLFVPVCERTDFSAPREEGGSWLEKCWSKIHEWWAKDSARVADELAMAKALASTTKAKAGGVEGLAKALSSRVTNPDLVDPDKQRALLTKLAICMHGSSDFYAMQEDGSYKGPFATLNSALGGLAFSVALELGFCWLKEKEGKLQQCWLDMPTVQRMSCARVTDATATFGTEIGRSRIVEILDGDMVRLATISAGTANQITPRWSDRVDRLMRVQTGCSIYDNSIITQSYREFVFWLAHVPLVERWKLPALFIYGAPRTGKSLWCRAVSLLFTGNASGGHVLTQKWNHTLAYSAIVAMDEGLPSLRGVAGKQATQMMRRVIVGDPVPVEAKGQNIRTAQMNWRVIASENSADSFYQLMESFGAFAARDEKKALATRIHMINVRAEAAQWITSQQGELFPDDGSCDFTLEMAQHALYLAANIDQHRETYFEDIHKCRMGNLIQFPTTITKEDATEALLPSEYSAMVSLMTDIVQIAQPTMLGMPRRLDYCIDRFGCVIATRAAIGESAGKRDAAMRAGRPLQGEKSFVDLFSTPVQCDDGETRKMASKQLYDLCTGDSIGEPLRRRWRKVEVDVLMNYLEERDVAGLDNFRSKLDAFRAARGLQHYHK